MVERSAHGSVLAETPPPRASLMLAHGFTVEQLVESCARGHPLRATCAAPSPMALIALAKALDRPPLIAASSASVSSRRFGSEGSELRIMVLLMIFSIGPGHGRDLKVEVMLTSAAGAGGCAGVAGRQGTALIGQRFRACHCSQ
jgi:hypothetical protein